MMTEDYLGKITTYSVEVRRVLISRHFHSMFEGKIQQGPLKGFAIDDDPAWGPGDLAPKLLGLYEQEILTLIESLRSRKKVLVNLGAADGYYGVGLVATNNFARSICYESSDQGRAYLERLSAQNGVADRVQIFGTATSSFPDDLKKLGISIDESLILCDVEGAEFDIFTDDCLRSLKGADVIIELHDFMVKDGSKALQKMVDAARNHFNLSLIKTGFRDLSGFPELDSLNDSDRWLICSEGRIQLMAWLHLSPR